MTTTERPIRPEQSMGELAATLPGASRAFHALGLDFCCGGAATLADACSAAGLDVDAVIGAIRDETRDTDAFERWDERSLDQLMDHLLEHFHEGHRREVPRLLEMAMKVERVHADKSACPHGLADHVARMGEELELHMQKEEEILFPLIRRGQGSMAAMPILVMEQEHRDHGANLARLRELTHDYTPPPEACATWDALYLSLAELERELMQHIHLENNVLFPRAARS